MIGRAGMIVMAALLLALPAYAVTAPRMKLASIADLPVVIEQPYDESADAAVAAGHVSALEDARHMTPQGLADWLAQWAK
jgi:hypothetical protein